jgi:hypothetical protein
VAPSNLEFRLPSSTARPEVWEVFQRLTILVTGRGAMLVAEIIKLGLRLSVTV